MPPEVDGKPGWQAFLAHRPRVGFSAAAGPCLAPFWPYMASGRDEPQSPWKFGLSLLCPDCQITIIIGSCRRLYPFFSNHPPPPARSFCALAGGGVPVTCAESEVNGMRFHSRWACVVVVAAFVQVASSNLVVATTTTGGTTAAQLAAQLAQRPVALEPSDFALRASWLMLTASCGGRCTTIRPADLMNRRIEEASANLNDKVAAQAISARSRSPTRKGRQGSSGRRAATHRRDALSGGPAPFALRVRVP